MDVYFTRDFLEYLKALILFSWPENPDGYLLGHKRGPSYIVEKGIPSQEGFFSSEKNFIQTASYFGEKLLGFYSFRMNSLKKNKIFTPAATGLVLVQISHNKEKINIQSHIIDFDRDFFLYPISSIQSGTEEKNGKTTEFLSKKIFT